MTDLVEKLGDVDRDIVVSDTVKLIDNEVANKSGVTGLALKGGYKVVKKLKNGRMIEVAAEGLLDDFASALNPIYNEFEDDDEASFSRYLAERSEEAANALLSITDSRAERADNKVLVKTYKKLRPTAKKHVVDALPGVGRLIDTHCPKDV